MRWLLTLALTLASVPALADIEMAGPATVTDGDSIKIDG